MSREVCRMINYVAQPLVIEGGAGLLTVLLGFGIVVVVITFVTMLWVTYQEWQSGTLW